MSLISKLFQRNQHEGDAPDAPSQPAERAELEQPAAPAEAEQAPGSAEQTAPAQQSDGEWWQSEPAGDPAPAANATAPLDPERLGDAGGEAHDEPTDDRSAPAASQPADEQDLPDTRPLDDHSPTLMALSSARGLAYAAMRDIGRVRAVNQDSVFGMLTTLPRESSDLTVGLFIVADGMGGHHGGEIASRMAVSTIARYLLAELIVPALADESSEAIQPLIIAAVQEANRTIWDYAQSLGSDMGTTCTVALLLGRALYLGHVGDTRAYLATPTGMRQITNDHSTVGRLIQVGQLDPSEAREHPLRSQLYRTVGQMPEVLVDFGYEQVGDATHLLLASDGLWGLLDDELLLDVLQHQQWPQDACSELIARANLAGGDDNISAIVVSLPAAH